MLLLFLLAAVVGRAAAGLARGASTMDRTAECGSLQDAYGLEGRSLQGSEGAYTLARCLGAGANGEAWLADHKGQQVVVKLLLSDSGRDDGLARECAFANAARERDWHFTKCVGLGSFVAPEIPYAAFERAPGVELERALHGAGTRAAPGLPSLADVLGKELELLAVVTALATPDARGEVLYLTDLSPSNLMLTEGGRLTIIDYGSVLRCAVATEDAAGDGHSCEPRAVAYARAMSVQYLVVDLLSMLVQRPQGVDIGAFQGALRALLIAGPADAPARVEAALRVPYALELLRGGAAFRAALRAGLEAMQAVMQGDDAWPLSQFQEALEAARSALAPAAAMPLGTVVRHA